MLPDIPSDQMERIRPTLETLHEQLRVIFKDLPDGPLCAIQFRPLEEE